MTRRFPPFARFATLAALALLGGCQVPPAPAPTPFSYRIEPATIEIQGVLLGGYRLEGDPLPSNTYVRERLWLEFHAWNRTPDRLRLWKDFHVSSLEALTPGGDEQFYIAQLALDTVDLSRLPTYAALQGLHGTYVFSSIEAAKTFQVFLALQQARDSLALRAVSLDGINILFQPPR